MIRAIDNLLNKITMYKIVLCILIGLVLIATGLSFLGVLSYNPVSILFSAFFITTVCLIINMVLARVFRVPANVESVYITALILALIITPLQSIHDVNFFTIAVWGSVLAMASKYIFAIGHKHITNPAAMGVVLTAIFLGQTASWWIATAWMLPFVLFGGYLITRKIRRFDLVLSFIITATIMIFVTGVYDVSNLFTNLWKIVVSTPIIFFSTVMLTEPLTTPPTRNLRILYGVLVGLLFSPAIHLGSVYSTPEAILVIGNIFSYIISPKKKLVLKLREARKVANDTYNFIFKTDKKMKFRPGQYLEWTISDKGADSRGNRRYFTIASSPTEKDIIMGVKFYPRPSSFKKELASMKPGEIILASQLSGDFTLPKDKKKKLVFVAGGIGVTPFRSMIKYLIDKKEKRDIVIMYSNKKISDIAYADLFDQAYRLLGIKTVHILTDPKSTPSYWKGEKGYINQEMLTREIPDFKDRTFYISGPHSMVVSFSDVLNSLGVDKSQMKKDFFPGFA